MSSAADEVERLFSQQEKRDRHPEDDDNDSAAESDLEEKNNQDEDASAAVQPNNMPTAVPSSNYSLPHFDANTGPKGVIADARSFQNAKRRGWGSRMRSSIFGMDSFAKETSNLTATPAPGEDEEEFMNRWRENRLAELRSGKDDPRRTRRMSPSKRKYGMVETVDAVGYLDAVERVPADTVVVVCIYDDVSDVSKLVEECLITLAQTHMTTRFVKLHYLEAEMDELSVPAILGYRGGELFANLVSVIDEIPSTQELSATSLETVLRQHDILE